MQRQLSVEESSANNQLTALRGAGQCELNAEAARIKRMVAERTSELARWTDDTKRLCPTEGFAIIDASLTEAQLLISSIRERFRRHSIWRRWFWPDVPCVAEITALKFLRRLTKDLWEFRLRLEIGEAVFRNELFSVIGIGGVARSQVKSYLDSVYEVHAARQKKLHEGLQNQIRGLLERRAMLVEGLNAEMERTVASIRKKLEPLVDKRDRLNEDVKAEARKLGLSV